MGFAEAALSAIASSQSQQYTGKGSPLLRSVAGFFFFRTKVFKHEGHEGGRRLLGRVLEGFLDNAFGGGAEVVGGEVRGEDPAGVADVGGGM